MRTSTTTCVDRVSDWHIFFCEGVSDDVTYLFRSGNLTFLSKDRDSLSDILVTSLCLVHRHPLVHHRFTWPPVSHIFLLHTHTLSSNSFSPAHTSLCNSYYFVIFRIFKPYTSSDLWGPEDLLFSGTAFSVQYKDPIHFESCSLSSSKRRALQQEIQS